MAARSMFQRIDSGVRLDPHGTLEVPEDAVVLYVEPALKMSAKKGTFLFLKPPDFKQSDYTDAISPGFFSFKTASHRDTLDMTDRKQTVVMRSPKTSPTKKEYQVLEEEFKESTEVLVRPFEYPDPKNPHQWIVHPFLKEVAIFKNTKEGVEILRQGYMYSDDLKKGKEKFVVIKSDIFPKLPESRDIRQAHLGNCFFLASLNAILSRPEGTGFILNMMKQQSNGTTIVRFFHPETQDPIYVRVDNSEHYIGGTVVKHRLSWVHILEKAFAGIGFLIPDTSVTAEKGKSNLMHPSFDSVFGEGGKVKDAMKILTGYTPIVVEIPSTSYFPLTHSSLDRLLYFDQINEKGREFYLKDLKDTDPILFRLLGNSSEIFFEFNNYLKKLDPTEFRYLKVMITVWSNLSNIDDDYEFCVKRLSEFKPELPKNVIAKFQNFNKGVLDDKREITVYAFPGRVGSGKYTEEQFRLFNDLMNLYNQGYLLTLSTRDDVGKNTGLFPKHAYTVTQVHVQNINGKNLLFIKIRNPWGHSGRIYDFANDEKFEKKGIRSSAVASEGHAEFNIDISEVPEFFFQYTAGELHVKQALQKKLSAPKGKS